MGGLNEPMPALATAVTKATIETDTKGIGKAGAEKIAAATVAAVKADPVLTNELSQEPWWQSGIAWYGTGGVLWSVGAIFTQVGNHGLDYTAYDAGQMVTAVGALAGFVGVLYRRFWPGLKPLFWRWTHKGEK